MALTEADILAKQIAEEIHPGDTPHHILIAQQFTREWLLQDLFLKTAEMRASLQAGTELDTLKGKRVKGLFYEPSTRTYESFESATQLQGGIFNGLMDAGRFSSAYKGESTADSMRVRNAYRHDAYVIRHDQVGGVALAAAASEAPVINAGDGDGQHPTQATTDVFTIFDTLGHIGDQRVLFVGDLKYGRTDHSLVYLLSKFDNMHFDFVSADERRMKQEIVDHIEEVGVSYSDYGRLTPELLAQADIVYVTRMQQERAGHDPLPPDYNPQHYRIDSEAVSYMKPGAIIMHPLPRLDELATEVDSDPRAKYFEQAENGMYTRMALLDMMLGRKAA